MNNPTQEATYKFTSSCTMDSHEGLMGARNRFHSGPQGQGLKISSLLAGNHIKESLNSSPCGKTQLFIGGMSNSTDLIELQHHLKAMAKCPHSGLYISVVKRLKRKTFSGYGIIKNIDSQDAEFLLGVGHFKFEGCWFGIKPFLKNKSVICFDPTEPRKRSI
jgi:hypothetical protein